MKAAAYPSSQLSKNHLVLVLWEGTVQFKAVGQGKVKQDMHRKQVCNFEGGPENSLNL